MKYSDQRIKQDDAIFLHYKEVFKETADAVVLDFHQAYKLTCEASDDPEIPTGAEDYAYDGFRNCFMYYCNGILSVIDPNSNFSVSHNEHKYANIERAINVKAKEHHRPERGSRKGSAKPLDV